MNGTFVVLHFVTCGRAPSEGGRMIEVAAIRIVDGQTTERYESLANAGVQLKRSVIARTGITQEMVDAAPPASVVTHELAGFIGVDPVVAHDADIDQQVFDSECKHAWLRAGLPPFICSLQLARRLCPHFGNHALDTLARAFGLYYPGKTRRAAADADVAANVVIQLCEQVRGSLLGAPPDETMLRQIMNMPRRHALAMLVEGPAASFAACAH